MYKYKTKSGLDCIIPGIGATVNGTIESPVVIESPNLELINEAAPPPVQQPAPAAPAQPVITETKETN